jgi:DNA polymerase-4
MAEEIRTIFFNEVGLTASAGISINKFVAKIASDYNKQMARKLLIR